MEQLDIKLWLTDSANQQRGKQPLKVAKSHIEGALKKTFPNTPTPDVKLGSAHPNPQYECACSWDPRYPIENPCTGDSKYYYSMGGWWFDYGRCEYAEKEYRDCHLLISDGPRGAGVTADRWATVGGAETLAEMSTSYSEHKGGKYGGAIQSVLHELGHALLWDYNDHNLGYSPTHYESTYYNAKTHRTPFMPAGPNDDAWEGENECYDSYDEPDDGYWALYYSDCAKEAIKESQKNHA